MADFDLSLSITADADDAENELRSLRKEVQDLKRTVDDLRKSEEGAGPTRKKATQDIEKLSSATRNQATAARGLGVQINDVATQFSLGARPMQVFAAQAGQIGFALQGMGGTLGKLGSALGGVYGAVGLLAVTGFTLLYNKLTQAETATKDLTRAQELQKLTINELTDAISKENEELKKSTQSSREAEQAALDAAEAKRQETARRLENARAALEEVKATKGEGAFQTGGVTQIGASEAERGRIQSDIDVLTRQLARVEQNVRLAQIPIQARQSGARTDPQKKIDEEYQSRIDNANKLYEQGTIALTELNRQLDNANSYRKTETERLREANRERGREATLPKVTGGEVGELLKGLLGGGTATSGVRSAAHNRAVGGAANSYHLSGQATDFVPRGGMGALPDNWKTLIREAAAAAGIKVLELLGPGDPDHSDHVHLAFARSRLGPDQVAAANAAAQRQADALASFGSQAGNRIGDLAGRFSMEPSRAVQIRQALADIDRIMSDIEKRKPPNFEELLAQGEQAKATIREAINKPFLDYIEDQKTALENQHLINTGREAEAEVLQVTAQLQKQVGDLLPEQVAAIRTMVQARRSEAREAELARRQQQKYLDALSASRDAFRGIFDFSGQGLRDLPKKLNQMVENLVGDWAFDKIFGSFFDDAADEVKGVMQPVKVGADELDRVIQQANAAIGSLADAAQSGASALSNDPLAALPDGGGDDPSKAVVVTGTRAASKAIRDPASFFGDVLEKLGKGVLGEQMAKRIGVIVGQAIQGAAIGQMVVGAVWGQGASGGQKIGGAIGGAIGQVAGNAIGSAIGGIAGSVVPVIGPIVGSLLGGALGGLFGGKKAPSGSATIGDAYGQATYSGSGSLRGQVSGLATNIQGSLQNIAQQLGGSLGNFNVSIGQDKNGDFVVDTLGRGRLKSGDNKTPEFKSAEEAMMFALFDAIKDGAITGLSAAVQKALRSSPDIDRAIREAMNVQELELAIGGIGDQLTKTFRDFEVEAKERLRLARTYGLDIVKVEELNAKEREKLLADVLEQRLGSLKQFLNDLNFGDLFEGTAADKRQALLTQIQTVKDQAAAGDEGAADRLAELERQLVETTREAFGTAGPEFAADREQARTNAEQIIALETQRAQEAQERAIAQLDAANTTNNLLNENNDLLSGILTTLRGGPGSGTVGSRLVEIGTDYDTSRLNGSTLLGG